ncbi:hypothetical protein BZL54_00865 [Burkholderia ubonensis subsp. mesacidophila]|uniref:Uncharacterized protein n=1 Tax=Burkholderia ubonensis subsp. mesacidophila TaxID=265293 RepID=A0A2A4FLZ7_9BURK|nr:hypothetical protein BZL54_00865 [Burkholderia ubonensis subsp. mesacidophila]
MKVLIVENEASVVDYPKAGLNDEGWVVEVSTDGGRCRLESRRIRWSRELQASTISIATSKLSVSGQVRIPIFSNVGFVVKGALRSIRMVISVRSMQRI